MNGTEILTRQIAAVALIALHARAVAAQANPQTIPTDLAIGIAGPYSGMLGGKPVFTVGSPAADWPAELKLPKTVTLIGSVTQGFIVSLVVHAPKALLPDQLATAVAPAPKWHDRPMMTNADGFSMSSVGMGGSGIEPAIRCAETAQFSAMVVDSAATTRTIMLTVVKYSARPGMSGVCNMPREIGMGSNWALKLPPLTPPRGVRVQARGSSGGGDSFEQTAEADKTMGADSLALHYGNELKKGGWTVDRKYFGSENTALSELSASDSTGARWNGSLVVTSTGDRRDIMIRMSRGP